MKLLISDKYFQNEVAEAREFLKIPEIGFTQTGEKDISKWAKWLETTTDEILDSRVFKSDLKNIRERLEKKSIPHPEARALTKKLDNMLPVNYWHSIGEAIALKFNMGKHFDKYIKEYILFNHIDAPNNNYSAGFYQAWERPSQARYIPINIYGQLTKDEWNELKSYVDSLTKNKFSKTGRIPNIDKYIKVEEAYKNRAGHYVHDEPNYLVSQSDIASAIFKDKTKASKVRDMLRRLEDLRKDKLTPIVRGKK